MAIRNAQIGGIDYGEDNLDNADMNDTNDEIISRLQNTTTGHDHDGTNSKQIGDLTISSSICNFNTSTGHDHDGVNSKIVTEMKDLADIIGLTGATPTASKVNVQTFTANGTWTKPTGATRVYVINWGAGGSGGASALGHSAGGAGGAYTTAWFDASVLGATETVTIGSGGAAVSGTSSGNHGGDSSFGTHLVSGGGRRGAAGSNNAVAGLRFNLITSIQEYGGTGGSNTTVGSSSIFGGAGGGGSDGNNAGGTSIYAGNGGAGVDGGNGIAGSTPAGGGGASKGGTSGAGARGEVRVYTLLR
jgi:hypothetical protein